MMSARSDGVPREQVSSGGYPDLRLTALYQLYIGHYCRVSQHQLSSFTVKLLLFMLKTIFIYDPYKRKRESLQKQDFVVKQNNLSKHESQPRVLNINRFKYYC